MAARNPLVVVVEYLALTEPPQVRKNAVTALAALEDPNGLATLSDVAISDPDMPIRDHAVTELASLAPPAAAIALRRILAQLSEPSKRRDAYALLGRLRNLGMSFQLPPLGLWTRVALVQSLRNQRYPKRGFWFLIRGLKGMSIALVLAWAAIVFYVPRAVGRQYSSEFVGAMVAAHYIFPWILLVVITMIATRRTSPLGFHADVAVAVAVDMVMAAVGTLIVVGFMISIDLVDEPHKSRAGILLVPVLTTLAAAATRVGTSAALGLVRTRAGQFLAEVVIGGLCALAVYETGGMLAGMMDVRLVGLGWAWTAVMVFGLAGAFARIDGEARPVVVASRPIRVGAFVLSGLAVLIGLTSLLPLPAVAVDVTVLDLPHSVPLRHVPATLTYHTSADVNVGLDNTDGYVAKRLDRSTIHVSRKASSANSDEMFDELYDSTVQVAKLLSWPQLRARIIRGAPDDGPVLLSVVFSAPEPATESPVAEPPAAVPAAPSAAPNQ